MQTEVMRTASAAQKFATDIWTAITSCDKDLAEKEGHQVTRITRLNDAVQFLQVADRKRAQEQNTWNNNCKKGARKQQEETERLAKEQQQLRTEVSAIKRVTTAPRPLTYSRPCQGKSHSPPPGKAPWRWPPEDKEETPPERHEHGWYSDPPFLNRPRAMRSQPRPLTAMTCTRSRRDPETR